MTTSPRPAWAEPPNPVVTTIKGVVIGVILLIMIYPLAYVILNSFASPEAVTTAGLFPSEWSLSAYTTIFKGGIVQRSLIVSILVTLVGTVLSLAVTSTLAYALTKTRQVPGVRAALYLVLLTMLFSAGIIPNYLVVKAFGLLDSYWSLIVPVLASAFNVVVMRNFFMQLPRELFEAARIDGAGDLLILIRIVIPLSLPALLTLVVVNALFVWNDLLIAIIFLQDDAKRTLMAGISVFQGRYNDQIPLTMAGMVFASAPMIILYLAFQKHYIRGLMAGSLK